MVESGDWLVPRYEGRPFFDKPILAYWAMASSMRVFGTSAGAARVVPLVASMLVVLATVWLGTLVYDRRSALTGGLVLATTLAFLSFARVAMSDMPLALWTTLAVALGVRACRPAAPGWTVPLLGAVLGLGLATKGPVAIVVPGLALLLLAWQRRERPLPVTIRSLVIGGAAFVGLGLGWFALVTAQMGTGPLVTFFFRENVERFAGEAYDVGRPLWFYLPAYLAEGLPWSPFLPLALARLLGARDSAERRGARFLAGWAALVLVPLSLSRGKIDYYLLPIYPALSLLLGRYFAQLPWRRLDQLWSRAALALGAGAAVFLLARPPQLPEPWLPPAAVRGLLVATLVAAALVLVATAVRPSAPRVLGALAGAVAAVFLLAVGFFVPAFAAGQPNRAIAADVARERLYEPRARLALCDDPSRARRDVLFAARHAARFECDLWSLAGSRQPYLLLVTPAQDASFRALRTYRHVASYRYLPASTLTLAGLLGATPPRELVLCANFGTSDPQAERKRKREYRRGVQREKETWAELAARRARARAE